MLPALASAAGPDSHLDTDKSFRSCTSTSSALAASARARRAVFKYCNPEGSQESIDESFSELDKRLYSPSHDIQESSSSSESQVQNVRVLYPKIMDAEMLQHNKYRSKSNIGVLPHPREEMHKKPSLLCEFCQDLLKVSVSAARDITSTASSQRLNASGALAVQDTSRLFEESIDVIRKLIIAGTLALYERLDSGRDAKLNDCEVDDIKAAESTRKSREGGNGFAELTYETLKRAQHLCAILLVRVEEEGFVGGGMSAELQRASATAFNNLACLYISACKPHAALFYLEQVLALERGASFQAEDAAGTHLNAATALGQLGQYNEAISHCRCALAIIRNADPAGTDPAAFLSRQPDAPAAAEREPAARRAVRALVQLALLHEAAGNVEAALGAWLSAAETEEESSGEGSALYKHAMARYSSLLTRRRLSAGDDPLESHRAEANDTSAAANLASARADDEASLQDAATAAGESIKRGHPLRPSGAVACWSIASDDGAQEVGGAAGAYSTSGRRMTAAHKEAIAIIEQSVPVLASSLRPADTFDSSILSHIMATVPKIEHPDPNKKKLPKDLDVLALLQDGAHFDVRSWRGVLPRRTAYDDLLSLLHFHLVLPLAFPLLVLYLGGHGQEYIVDSEKTLKAAISDALTRRDRSGRSQIVFAVRRSPRPLFHTAAREEAALRLQSAWRMLRARRRLVKARQRAFNRSLFLGRYQIDGLPSLCQHRVLVAEMSKRHGYSQHQSLHLVARRLQSILARDPARQACGDEAAADNLALRIKPSAPESARSTIQDWMAQSRSMALHQLYNALPLPLKQESDPGDTPRSHVNTIEQECVLERGARIEELQRESVGQTAGLETEAERLRRSISELHAHSPQTEPASAAEALRSGAAQQDGGQVPVCKHDVEEQADLEGAAVADGIGGRPGTPDELKGDWKGRAMHSFDERAILHLDLCTATDWLAKTEEEQAAKQAAKQADALHEHGTMSVGSPSGSGATRPPLIEGRTGGQEGKGTAVNTGGKSKWSKARNSFRAVKALQSGAHQDGARGVSHRVLIRFTNASDNIHGRHTSLLRKCEGPFVVPVLDEVDPDARPTDDELPEQDETEGEPTADVFERLTKSDGETRGGCLVRVRAGGCDLSTQVVTPAELIRQERAARRREQELVACRMLQGRQGARQAGRGRDENVAEASGENKKPVRPTRQQRVPGAGGERKKRKERTSPSPEIPQRPIRCAIVTPLPCTNLKAALAEAHTKRKAVEPLVQALGSILQFLHMKGLCLVELDLTWIHKLSDGTWRAADLSYARPIGSRLATKDPYMLKQLKQRCMVPEVLLADANDELDPDAPARSDLLAREAVDVFNFGLFCHLAVTGRDYFRDRKSAHQQLVEQKFPLQMIQSFSAHPAIVFLFQEVLVRSPAARTRLRDVLSRFDELMYTSREIERDREAAQGTLGYSGSSIHVAVKHALKELSAPMREGLLRNRETGTS